MLSLHFAFGSPVYIAMCCPIGQFFFLRNYTFDARDTLVLFIGSLVQFICAGIFILNKVLTERRPGVMFAAALFSVHIMVALGMLVMNPEQQLSALLAECLGGQSELCSRDYVLLRWVWMIGFTPIPIRFINLWYRGEILGKLLPGWKSGPRGYTV
ncbi:hypothetical protein BT96DRAFT_635579 [Gymnopus androsaceus JB14]|uniref:Uncharacterized protein n=1 Tax=Gymnopus androsaceus JB14 TaxID=1447944 RepID=A0A6A4HQQ5_9AGAR|nr:hypothetical protein BT96DRAFT_635579 [Gymnopus androsaceus JB14]